MRVGHTKIFRVKGDRAHRTIIQAARITVRGGAIPPHPDVRRGSTYRGRYVANREDQLRRARLQPRGSRSRVQAARMLQAQRRIVNSVSNEP